MVLTLKHKNKSSYDNKSSRVLSSSFTLKYPESQEIQPRDKKCQLYLVYLDVYI